MQTGLNKSPLVRIKFSTSNSQRDLAKSFNHLYGNVFTQPEPVLCWSTLKMTWESS